MTSRRGFLGAIAAALVLDPERALWVPGAKKIFLPPAPRPVSGASLVALFNLGDVVTFGNDPQRFVCMNAGDATGLGASFAFLHDRGLPRGTRFPDKVGVGLPPRGVRLLLPGFKSRYPPALVLKG